LLLADTKKLKVLEMSIWRRVERGGWKDNETNVDVLQRVNGTSILDTIWRRQIAGFHMFLGMMIF